MAFFNWKFQLGVIRRAAKVKKGRKPVLVAVDAKRRLIMFALLCPSKSLKLF